MNTLTKSVITTLLATLTAACDQAPVEQQAAAKAEASKAEAANPAPKARTACEWVTVEEMAAILGAPLTTEPSSSECNYTPTDGSGLPMAQLAVELGSAEAAMTATGMLGQIEPGMTNPYEGMGDQASAIGPAIWVRRGDDLVRIMVMGVEDHDAAVRRVYELVEAKF